MNYELVKKLKESGFPQPYQRVPKQFLEEAKKSFYDPNLSELIKACGKKFGSLEKVKIGWRAKSWNTLYKDEIPPILCIEKTPEEAIANLWLKLNKKQ